MPKPATTSAISSLQAAAAIASARKGQEPVFVEIPEGEEQERSREGDGMEFVEREPTGGRIEEVGEREPECGVRGAEMLARQPVHGKSSDCDRDRLSDEQQIRARPDPPQRGEDDEDRVDVSRQPRDLVAVQVGHLERMSVGRRPDGLHHVPEVEPAGDERVVAQSRERREAGGVRGDACDEKETRAREERKPSHNSRSMIPRHRSPSTASLALRS